ECPPHAADRPRHGNHRPRARPRTSHHRNRMRRARQPPCDGTTLPSLFESGARHRRGRARRPRDHARGSRARAALRGDRRRAPRFPPRRRAHHPQRRVRRGFPQHGARPAPRRPAHDRHALPGARFPRPRARDASGPAQQPRCALQALQRRQLAAGAARRAARCPAPRRSLSRDDRRPGCARTRRDHRSRPLDGVAHRPPARASGRAAPRDRGDRGGAARARGVPRSHREKGGHLRVAHDRAGRCARGRSRMKVLVTGAAGFIGFHTSKRLLARGDEVVGLDNLNPYYDVTLKQARLAQLTQTAGFRFAQLDLADQAAMTELFRRERFERIVHLAAQAGVRYSLEAPHTYVASNVTGTLNVLEGCRHNGVEHLVYASTSSVYGANTNMPFSVHNIADHPLSLYASTKRANELMAHNYASLFKLPTTGLRFFTVYGPWGRPDMALFM